MEKIVLNKKKFQINIILFYFFILLFIIIFVFSFNKFIYTTSNKEKLVNYFEKVSNKYGYILTNVEINGLNNLSKNDIEKFFLEYNNKSIFFLPLTEIKNKISENRWIKSVTIKNTFKNKIIIDIREHEPNAVFFNGKNYYLINNYGEIIDFAKTVDIQKYVVLIGDDSRIKSSSLISKIPEELVSNIKKAKFIGNRRWNIYTNENIEVKLPEEEYVKSMETFINIYANLIASGTKNIEYIDMRIPERAIIKFYNETEKKIKE